MRHGCWAGWRLNVDCRNHSTHGNHPRLCGTTTTGGCDVPQATRSRKGSRHVKPASATTTVSQRCDERPKRKKIISISAARLHLSASIVSVLCYVNSLKGDFVHDDVVAITANPDVLGKTPLTQVFLNDFWGKPMADPESHKSYRPLTVLTFRLNMALGEDSVVGFHTINVALHTIAVCLLIILCRNVLHWKSEDTFTASLLFATHPIHTEAVASIVGRADVLSCVFFLSSFLFFVKCTKENVNTRHIPVYLLLSIVSATCALLAKEQGVTVLGVSLGFYTLLRWEKENCCLSWSAINWMKRYIRDSRVFCTIIATLVLISMRLWMLNGSLPQFSDQDNPTSFCPCRITRFLTYSYLAAFNSWLLLCPSNLSYDWQMGSIPLVQSVFDPRNVATILLTATITALVWYIVRVAQDDDRKTSFLALCLLILPFLPASNLFVTVGFVVAERVLYIPSLGFCILVAHGIRKLRQQGPRKRFLCSCATSVLITFFVMKTVTRNVVWSSREALFKSGLESVPQNAKVYYNYANLQKDIGNVDKAVQHYRIALKLWPDHASAHNNLGTLLNDFKEAEKHFKTALRINPNHARAHFNLANLYSKQGQDVIAKTLLERSVNLDPNFAEAFSSLASLYADIGRIRQAEAYHLKAIDLDSTNADSYNNYGTFLQKTGRNDEAVRQYQQAITLQPNHTVALVNAAKTMRSLKQARQAEDFYKRALSIQEDPQIMDNLGVLYINTGRQTEARSLYDRLQRTFPDHLDGQVHFAQLLLQERNYTEAENILLKVTATNKEHREALHLLAALYSQTNKTTQALHYVVQALSFCSSDDSSCARIYADHGDILKDLQDLGTAAQSYEFATQLDPNLAHAHLNLAVIHHIQGNFMQALRHYQAAYSLHPENQLVVDNMSKLRRTLKRSSKSEWRLINQTCRKV